MLVLTIIVMPTSRCKLRLLRLERIKDWLLMEEEFLNNQEAVKPREAQEQVSFYFPLHLPPSPSPTSSSC
jgi:hypothetical protein